MDGRNTEVLKRLAWEITKPLYIDIRKLVYMPESMFQSNIKKQSIYLVEKLQKAKTDDMN